jgi:hypothetical protein
LEIRKGVDPHATSKASAEPSIREGDRIELVVLLFVASALFRRDRQACVPPRSPWRGEKRRHAAAAVIKAPPPLMHQQACSAMVGETGGAVAVRTTTTITNIDSTPVREEETDFPSESTPQLAVQMDLVQPSRALVPPTTTTTGTLGP